MNDNLTGFFEEYKSLRQEIAKRRDARLIILGFTLTIEGILIGLTLGDNSNSIHGLDYYSLGLLGFALAVLIAALLMTIHHTQRKIIISAYIRKYIEPVVSGIQWESRWNLYLESKRSHPRAGGLPLDMSKALALSYGFLTIAIYSMSFVTGLYKNWLSALILSVFAIYSLSCSIDLYKRISKGWKFNWDLIDKPKK
jgi:hypothetical protein